MEKTNGIGDVFSADGETYSTCDLYLAAFYVTAGMKMIDQYRDKTSRRVYFIFDKNEMLIDLKVKYYKRDAKIDALTFSDNIKSLKSLCHNITNMK